MTFHENAVDTNQDQGVYITSQCDLEFERLRHR